MPAAAGFPPAAAEFGKKEDRIMKRKIFCFVLSLIFALSFAACAPGESETPPDGGTDTIANPWLTTTGTLEKQD